MHKKGDFVKAQLVQDNTQRISLNGLWKEKKKDIFMWTIEMIGELLFHEVVYIKLNAIKS